jgi:hypothetical protein
MNAAHYYYYYYYHHHTIGYHLWVSEAASQVGRSGGDVAADCFITLCSSAYLIYRELAIDKVFLVLDSELC